MNWAQIFSETFVTNFWQEFNVWVNGFIGQPSTTDMYNTYYGTGILLPFVFFTIAILVTSRILHMIRGVAEGGQGDKASVKSARGEGWRDE